MENIKGMYKHFKGNEYEVFGTYFNENDGLDYIVYKPLYNDSGFWIRPYDMFFEKVDRDGNTFDRFQFIKKTDNVLDIDFIVAKHSETLDEFRINVKKIKEMRS